MLSLKYRVFAICTLIAVLVVAIHAAPIQPISYQGRLTDVSGNPVANGTYNVTFTIYSAAKLGPTLWTEEHNVTTSDGLFTALLGSRVPFGPSLFSEFPRYLGITIGAGPEMSPRILMASVPYALNAPGGTSGYWQQSGSSIYYNGGNVGIGTATPGDMLEVNGGVTINWWDGPRLTLKDGTAGAERPRISFNGDYLAIFDGDAATGHIFSFMNTFGNVRNFDASLRIHGRAANHWGTFLDLTHDGTHGIISTDVGGIRLAPANGSVVFSGDSRWQSGGTDRVVVDPNNQMLQVFGSNGVERVRLCKDNVGQGLLVLYDSSLSTYGAALLSAVGFGGGKGGNLMLNDSTNALNVWMDAGAKGNSSVMLQDGAIDSREILDEPGIAASQQLSGIPVYLPCTGPVDLLTLSITIPAPGYIVLDARCQVILTMLGATEGYVQIDEDSGGDKLESATTFRYTFYEYHNGEFRFPISTYRVYFKPAGTYTFRLEGDGPCSVSLVDNPMMKAMYYPTSYGLVATMVSSAEASQFDNAEALSVLNGPDGKGPATTMYQVDLRELELKAAKLRAETEKVERELAEAKMNEMRKQQNQTTSDKK